MERTNIESRLAKHAEEKLRTVVSRVSYTHPFAIMLGYSTDSQIGRYLRDYVDYILQGKLPTKIVEDAMLDGNPKVPADWEEISRRYLACEPAVKEIEGEINIIDSNRGVYLSPKSLSEILKLGDISIREFEKVFGFNPSERGIALVNEHMPNKEAKLITQIHETIHARDDLNGLGEYEKGYSLRGRAFELLTDLRAYTLGNVFLSEDFHKYVDFLIKNAEKNGLTSGYFIQSKENIALLKKLSSKNGHVDMMVFLENLKSGLKSDDRVRRLVLDAPCFKHSHSDKSPSERANGVNEVLDTLISVEKQSKLPQVVPV